MLCPVILGRDDLLDLMDHLIAEARQGHGRTLFLSGSGRARQDAAHPGDGPQGRGGRAPRRRRLRRAAGPPGPARLDPRDGDRHARQRRLGHAVARTCSRSTAATTAMRSAPAALIVRAAADRILEAIDRPTLLVFDDLHWADEMSLEVIGELARHADRAPAVPPRRLSRRRVPGRHDPPRMAGAAAQPAPRRGGPAPSR